MQRRRARGGCHRESSSHEIGKKSLEFCDLRSLNHPSGIEWLEESLPLGVVEVRSCNWNLHAFAGDAICERRHSTTLLNPSIKAVVARNPSNCSAFSTLPMR